MKKKTSTILIGVLIVAGLILALPFSPLRKSFNSSAYSFSDKVLSDITYIDNTKNKKIASSVSNSLRSAELQGLYDNILVQNKNKGRNNGINDELLNGKSSIAGLNNKLNSNSQIENTPSGLSGISGSNLKAVNGSGGDVAILNNSSSNLKNVKSQVNTGTNYIAMSTDLTTPAAATKETVKQLAGGGPPPGEIEPTPPSLPIGDGYYFMLLLSVLFITVKIRKVAL